jgi:peptidylprolyl isomerase
MKLLVAVSVLAVATAANAAPPAKPAQARPAAQASDFREVDPENTLVIDTTKGRIIVELIPEAAPNHVERIKQLARAKFYDGLTFFRVIDDFMAQTGDPQNTGAGGSDKPDLAGEFVFRRGKALPMTVFVTSADQQAGFLRSLPVVSEGETAMAAAANGEVQAAGVYCPGVAGIARTHDPNSANSQFFLMRQSNMALNAKYTAFGRVIAGLDVVRSLNVGEPPESPDKMTQVRVLADLPAAQRPRVRVMDTAGAAFKALVAQAQAAKGEDFFICDVDVPAQVIEPR